VTWEAIFRHYDEHHRPRVLHERSWFNQSGSLKEAIGRAALATDDRGKRFDHQRRIPRTTLEATRDALLANTTAIKAAPDFDQLLKIVTAATSDIHRAGELYAYDTALRIAYYRDLLPTKVYLHAGTSTGARALGLPHNRAAIEHRQLPPGLRDRSAHEVEDILCIYKDRFTRVGPNPAPSNTFSNTCGSRPPKRNAARSC
jgi:hypothetical protein